MLRRITLILSALCAVFFSPVSFAGGSLCFFSSGASISAALRVFPEGRYYSGVPQIVAALVADEYENVTVLSSSNACSAVGSMVYRGSTYSWAIEGNPQPSCPDGQAVGMAYASPVCVTPVCPMGVNADGSCKVGKTPAEVAAAAAKSLKGQGFSVSASVAAETAAQNAYSACVAAASPNCETAANDAAYMAAVDSEKNSVTNSIMGKAILGGIAAAGIIAALPAFIAAGTVGAAASLAVSFVAASGFAVESYQASSDGSYKQPTSSAAVPLNVRLTGSSPSLAGVPEASYNATSNTFAPSMSPSADPAKSWQAVEGGGFKSVDSVTGYTTQISADGATVESKKQVSGQWVVSKLEATAVQGDTGQEKAILYTRTGPISTDAGTATASVSSVYTPSTKTFSQEVVAVTDAVTAAGVRTAVTDSTALASSSGGGGASIASQFSGQGNAAGSGAVGVAGVGNGASGPAGTGMDCGGPGKPACMVDLASGASFIVPQSGRDEIKAITDGLSKTGTDGIKAIESSGDQNGLLTWAMLPLPVTTACVDPVFSFSNQSIPFSGFCDKMTLLRAAAEYILYLVTLMYCFKLVTESQKEV